MKLLPFNFQKIEEKYLLTNFLGEYIFLDQKDFRNLSASIFDFDPEIYNDLKSKFFIYDNEDLVTKMYSNRLITKKSFVSTFTSLHMVVPTLRCNSNCKYCQVSSKENIDDSCNMNIITAKKIIDYIFRSNSIDIKIEFQGGEPLLNFEIVKFMVKYAKKLNKVYHKNLEFVICSNLTLINDSIMKFLNEHNIYISSSLDGNSQVHNYHRPLLNDENSYSIVKEKIETIKNTLGDHKISCLLTISKYSKGHIKDIIDEYRNLNFHSIFLRQINPYGRANYNEDELIINADEFFEIYKEGLDYILNINLNGEFFVEELSTIFLRKILTPFATGFVDMQNPSGFGISCALYNHNGDVYGSDEGRMLGEIGNKKFCIGNVNENNYEDIFYRDKLKNLLKASMLENFYECNDCVFFPYCGSDPVRQDIENYSAISVYKTNYCRKNKLIFKYIFDLIRQDDEKIMNIFWAWISNKPELIYD